MPSAKGKPPFLTGIEKYDFSIKVAGKLQHLWQGALIETFASVTNTISTGINPSDNTSDSVITRKILLLQNLIQRLLMNS
jgi:hypothetical protein